MNHFKSTMESQVFTASELRPAYNSPEGGLNLRFHCISPEWDPLATSQESNACNTSMACWIGNLSVSPPGEWRWRLGIRWDCFGEGKSRPHWNRADLCDTICSNSTYSCASTCFAFYICTYIKWALFNVLCIAGKKWVKLNITKIKITLMWVSSALLKKKKYQLIAYNTFWGSMWLCIDILLYGMNCFWLVYLGWHRTGFQYRRRYWQPSHRRGPQYIHYQGDRRGSSSSRRSP